MCINAIWKFGPDKYIFFFFKKEEEEVLDTYIMHDPTSTLQLKR